MKRLDSRMRLLVLFANYTDRLSYYDDWLEAFLRSPQFDVYSVDIVRPQARKSILKWIKEVDAIVLLHSTNGDTTDYLEQYIDILEARPVPLLAFVGNEVNLPGSPIAKKRKLFKRIMPDIIATQLLLEAGQYLFGDVAQQVVTIPHALNPDAFQPLGGDNRFIDIGARAVKYIPHLGDDDRNRILDAFKKEGSRWGLRVDISDKRYDRAGWARFLNDCKGTVSTEAGSWFLERDDETVTAIREYVLGKQKGRFILRNDSALRKMGHRLPWWARSLVRRILKHGLITHEAMINETENEYDIHQLFFKNKPRPNIYGKCISSRHFDAIGTKTCQIMFPGRFNDILKPDLHYFALADDFSNVFEILEKFNDVKERKRVVDAAYDLVIDQHTYSHRIAEIYNILQ